RRAPRYLLPNAARPGASRYAADAPAAVHGRVEIVFAGCGKLQGFGQTAAGGRRLQAARSSQLRAGFQDARGNQSQHQLGLGRGGRIDLFIQTDAMNGAEHGGDMSVGQGASDLHWLPSRKEEFTAQDAAQGVDLSSRPGREIGEGTFVDLPAFASGFAEQDGGWRVAVGDRLHVHGDMLSNTKHNGNNDGDNYMGTYFTARIPYAIPP